MQGYITPTIVHFGTVFALAAYMSVPNQTVIGLSLGLGIGGTGTLIYTAAIANNVRRFASQYEPVIEDWIWHVILPALDYAALVVMAFLIWYRVELTLYCTAAALTLLLFIGIHNALDVAVSVTAQKQKDRDRKGKESPGE
jgi:hypothetical protein